MTIAVLERFLSSGERWSEHFRPYRDFEPFPQKLYQRRALTVKLSGNLGAVPLVSS